MNKTVMLFSGGLDSVCIEHLLKPEKLIYINMRTMVCKQERMFIHTHNYNPIVLSIPALANYELKNSIIPGRNAVFVLMAAQHGSTIYLGSTAGDTTKDKDPLFADRMTSLLLHIMEKGKCPEDIDPSAYEVVLPFRRHSKTELVRLYLEHGGSTSRLMYSYSCYSGADKQCGTCRSCLRKYVALRLNGVDMRRFFKLNPQSYLNTLLEYSVVTGRASSEIDEIKEVLEMDKS